MTVDPQADFAVIGRTAPAPLVMVMAPQLPQRSVAELVAAAKAAPKVVKRLNSSLLEPVIETIEESEHFIAAEVPRQVALLKAAKFEPQ